MVARKHNLVNTASHSPLLLGMCRGASQMEKGLISSESAPSPADWHIKCPGVGSDGRICECDCHPDGICRACKTDEVPEGFPLCVDEIGCKRRQHEQLQAHPKYQMLQECKQKAKEVQGETRVVRRAERVERVVRPTLGRCEHCGDATKGGKFAPGHDAKLKGSLLEAATSMDPGAQNRAIDACVELMLRNWMTANARKKIADELICQAEALHHDRGQTWLTQRVADRIGGPHQ